MSIGVNPKGCDPKKMCYLNITWEMVTKSSESWRLDSVGPGYDTYGEDNGHGRSRSREDTVAV